MPNPFQRPPRKRFLDRPYPVELALQYQIVPDGGVLDAGRGSTVSISSIRVRFKSTHLIPVGLKIEAWVEWPVRLHSILPLRLYIHGETVETEDGCNVVRILYHEFHISK